MVSASPSALTSLAETRAPSEAKRNAVARPIPEPAPVTMTTLPSNRRTVQPSPVGARSMCAGNYLVAETRDRVQPSRNPALGPWVSIHGAQMRSVTPAAARRWRVAGEVL